MRPTLYQITPTPRHHGETTRRRPAGRRTGRPPHRRRGSPRLRRHSRRASRTGPDRRGARSTAHGIDCALSRRGAQHGNDLRRDGAWTAAPGKADPPAVAVDGKSVANGYSLPALPPNPRTGTVCQCSLRSGTTATGPKTQRARVLRRSPLRSGTLFKWTTSSACHHFPAPNGTRCGEVTSTTSSSAHLCAPHSAPARTAPGRQPRTTAHDRPCRHRVRTGQAHRH